MSRPTTTRRRKADLRREEPEAPQAAPVEPEAAEPAPRRRAQAPVEDAPQPERRKIAQDDLLAIAAMDPAEVAALMEGSVGRVQHEVGAQVQGVVGRIGRDDLFIELGGKSEGTIDRAELPDANVGDAVTAYIIEADEHGVRLSTRLSGAAAADHLEEARASGVPVEGKVTKRNSGGFEVRIGSARAFCPISRISRLPDVDPDGYVGQVLQFRVLETGDKVVLDRRVLQEEDVAAKAEELWRTLQPGDALRGVVRNVQPFGVFVDIGGIDGLVPRRELSWGGAPIRLSPGQGVDVHILEIDRDARKVTLSAKDPGDDPWQLIGDAFHPGGVYAGEVVRVEPFGAFVRLSDGLDGLVHISKLPAGLPQPGDALTVRLLSVDDERRRLELAPATDAELTEVGATAKGTVAQVLKNGVVVQLDDGRTGWLPAAEVDLPAGTVLAQRFRVGKPVQGRVVEERPDRVTLSLKEDPSKGGSWRSQVGERKESGSFGTLADLFSGLNLRK